MNFVTKKAYSSLAILAAVLCLGIAQTTLAADASNAFVLSLVQKVAAAHAPASKKTAVTTTTSPKKGAVPSSSSKTTSSPAKNVANTTSSSKDSLSSLIAAQGAKPITDTGLNEATRNALVNILCTTKAGGYFRPISGSGVVIDPRGVILTNAHVAQYMLLKDYLVPGFVSCTIRTGSPAVATYTAKLLYVPPTWVAQNAHYLTSSTPLGSGQYDFALLAITGTVSPDAPMPASFSYLPVNSALDVASANYPVLIGGYPAEFVGNVLTQKDLYAVTSQATLTQAYYYEGDDPDTIDLYSLSPTILAQAGSSGGAVTSRLDGNLIGILVTTTSGSTTAQKVLNAVNIAHINRTLKTLTGTTLGEFLKGDLAEKTRTFEETSYPALRDLLIAAIQQG